MSMKTETPFSSTIEKTPRLRIGETNMLPQHEFHAQSWVVNVTTNFDVAPCRTDFRKDE
jgi:hypothetical protein